MSQFCKDCRHFYTHEYLLRPLCTAKATRQNISQVTGELIETSIPTCKAARGGDATCPDFVPKPTLIQRLKEVFS